MSLPTTQRESDTAYQVLTPERVSLRYDLAGIGSRSAAAMIDVTLQSLAGFVLTLGLIGVSALVDGGSGGGVLDIAGQGPGIIIVPLLVLGLFLILWGYYMLFEIVWNGQTPGKRLMHVRVIRENGYPIRAADSVIRNLVRILDGPPFGAVIGLMVMLLNSRAKRLGDFAAGTVVVREGAGRPLAGSLAAGESGPRGVALSAADATLVRDFLTRRGGMRPESRAELAGRIAQALGHRYGLAAERDATSDEAFLEGLVREG